MRVGMDVYSRIEAEQDALALLALCSAVAGQLGKYAQLVETINDDATDTPGESLLQLTSWLGIAVQMNMLGRRARAACDCQLTK